MSRQHATPVLIKTDSTVALRPFAHATGGSQVSEADIQALVHSHPEILPIAEIDSMFVGAVPICRELNTNAGPIDNFLVTPSGLPVIVECKLWRNPEGRREVVGQILDYAKELSRWSSSDLQREVRTRLKRSGDPILDLVRAADAHIEEIQFNDALTANLRRGRFLLLIVGDGIREGVEAIAEYLQDHAGLHFSLGLVELPIFMLPDGSRLVTPRVLARTTVISRTVVAMPEGFTLQAPDEAAVEPVANSDRAALGDAQRKFWADFLSQLKLDDPEQPRPNPARLGYISLSLPAPHGSSWLTVYRDMKAGTVGVFLSSHRNTAGDYAKRAIAEEWDSVKELLGGTAQLSTDQYGGPQIGDKREFGTLESTENRRAAFEWLAERTNTFVNVLRPRVRSASADYQTRRMNADEGVAS